MESLIFEIANQIMQTTAYKLLCVVCGVVLGGSIYRSYKFGRITPL